MSIQLAIQPLALGYFSPEEEERVLAGLNCIRAYQGELLKEDTNHLEQTLKIATDWQLPSRSLLILMACSLLKNRVAVPTEKTHPFDVEIVELAKTLLELDQPPAKQHVTDTLQKVYHFNQLRRLFITAYTHLDLALLVLASHTARMRSIDLLDPRQARLLAEDNEAVFLPLMECLGAWQLRRELGDLSLKTLNPQKLWEKIQSQKEAATEKIKPVNDQILERLAAGLRTAGIQANISPHLSPNSSLYRHLQHNESLSEVLRQVKINVSVLTPADCYQVLRIVHGLWPPLAGRTLFGGYFNDLIAAPKFNGFRSLLTTAGFPNPAQPGLRIPVEFRLFTQEMKQINLMGVIAARYLLKPAPILPGVWWDDSELIEFVRSRPIGSSSNKIYVFSPVGKVYRNLQPGCTPIDYAYRIHSEVGNHCKRIWVNGEPAPYYRALCNGDLIEIEMDANYPGPDERWLQVVKTSTAKVQIKRALHKQTPHKGRQIIDRILQQELRNYALQDEISEEDVQKFLEEIAGYYGYSDLTALYLDIAEPQRGSGKKPVSPNRLVSRLIVRKLSEHITRMDGKPLGFHTHHIRFAQCREEGYIQHVSLGCDIVGRILQPGTEYERLVIYRSEWPNAPRGNEVLPLEWTGSRQLVEPVRICIQAVDRFRLLDRILAPVYELYDQGLYLLGVQAAVNREQLAEIEVTVESSEYWPVKLLEEKLGEMKTYCILDDFRIETLSPIEKARLRQPNSMPNPYTTGPVYDRRLFKGRDNEINQILSTLKGDQNLIVLYGINRVGKTSLLRYLYKHLSEETNYVPVLIDMPGMAEHREDRLWQEIADGIESAFARLYRGKKSRLLPHFRVAKNNAYESFRRWLREVQEAAPDRRLLILFDELNVIDELWKDEQAALQTVYRLKSIVEDEHKTGFILCVQETLYRQLSASQNRSICTSLLRAGFPLRLDYIDRTAAERLIREPMGQMLLYDDRVVAHILDLTACHPYYLQNILHALVNRVSMERRNQVSAEDLDATLPQILGNGQHLFHNFIQEKHHWFRWAVLRALASLAGPENQRVSAEEICNALEKRGFRKQLNGLSDTLDKLLDSGVIERLNAPGKVRYRVRVPLFSHWLANNYPLNSIEPPIRKDQHGKNR